MCLFGHPHLFMVPDRGLFVIHPWSVYGLLTNAGRIKQWFYLVMVCRFLSLMSSHSWIYHRSHGFHPRHATAAPLLTECTIEVTPGVVKPTFQSRSARPFRWKPGIADRLRSNPRAVPNVYQTGLVSFGFNLGTQYLE
jgi:hypothetical protein